MQLTRIVLPTIVFLSAATAQTPPYALFQQANLAGSNNTITATQIPVITSSGAVIYLNATIQFNVDANGNLTISSGFPQLTPAPPLITGNFRAGKYLAPSNVLGGKAAIIVAGPGVTDGGATMWTISVANGADPGTYPSSATFYVGPISSNPLAARLSSAKIANTSWSYGVTGSAAGGSGSGNNWPTDSLIGLSQVGTTLTIVSFYNTNGYTTPVDQITYTLAPGQ